LRGEATQLRFFGYSFPHLHPDGLAESDRFFTTDFRPEVYTPAGFAWVQNNSLRTVLERHVPQLRPHFANIRNVYFPWDKTSAGVSERWGRVNAKLAVRRNLNVWIYPPTPTAKQVFHIFINIGTGHESIGAPASFAEPGYDKGTNLVISLLSLECEVEPSWQEITLPRHGDSEIVEFVVSTNIAGDHEFSIQVYLAKQMIMLQSLSFVVTVSASSKAQQVPA
jgi:hypothetical protein